MKIERIQIHLPSATTGPHGSPEHHQRISRSGDSPDRGKQQRQSPHEGDDEKQTEQAERLSVEVVTTQDTPDDQASPASGSSPHLLDIKA